MLLYRGQKVTPVGITEAGGMPMPSATVLLTRPEADSRRFAALLPDLPVLISPILRIVPVPHDRRRLAQAEGFVFTSAHGVAAVGDGHGRRALAVGPRTAAAARDAGFLVTEGAGDASGLMDMIAACPLPLLYPRGRHVAQRLPVEEIVVYDQQPLPLSQEAGELLAGPAPVILPLFSARSAGLLRAAMPSRPAAPLLLAAISRAALTGWTDTGADVEPVRTELAAQPNSEGMRAAVIRLLLREQ